MSATPVGRVRGLPYARPLGKPISMRLSRAVSSAMTTPTPLPRGPGGTRRTAERLSAGRPRPACNPAPDGPGRALAHSPGSGPAADTEEKKVGGKRKCPDLFGSRGGGRGRVPPGARNHPGPASGTRAGGARQLVGVADTEEGSPSPGP